MKYFTIFIILFLYKACTNKNLNESKYSKLDNYLIDLGSKKIAMGSALLYKKGKVLYSKNYGFGEQPKDPIYRIGSISKTYTTVIIAKLVENKLLSYQDKLSKFSPEIPNADKNYD